MRQFPHLACVIATALSFHTSRAADISLNGTVANLDGAPLEGIEVSLKTAKLSTISDKSGSWTLSGVSGVDPRRHAMPVASGFVGVSNHHLVAERAGTTVDGRRLGNGALRGMDGIRHADRSTATAVDTLVFRWMGLEASRIALDSFPTAPLTTTRLDTGSLRWPAPQFSTVQRTANTSLFVDLATNGRQGLIWFTLDSSEPGYGTLPRTMALLLTKSVRIKAITTGTGKLPSAVTTGDFQIVPYPHGTLVDPRDGQTYKTTVIDGQTWMAQNLNYSGDDGAGRRAFKLGMCYGQGIADTTRHEDSPTCAEVGRFYNWTTAMALPDTFLGAAAMARIQTRHRGICPEGWHLPTASDWVVLKDYVLLQAWKERYGSMTPIPSLLNSGMEGTFLKDGVSPLDSGVWNLQLTNTGNPYGFSALPAGKADIYSNGIWSGRWQNATFWTASEKDESSAGSESLSAESYGLSFTDDNDKHYAASVRCLKN